MTPISADVGTSMLSNVAQVGNYIITSLVNLSPAFIAIAGILIVVSFVGTLIAFRRN